MTVVATPVVATPTSPPPRRRSARRLVRRFTPRVAFVIAALPLIVAAVAIAVRAPAIDWTGDRALTELAVREAAHGRQLLGIGGRFGWRHPGPMWMQVLVPGYELTGHAPWSLSVGALAVHIAMVGVAVSATARAAGARGAAALAAAIAVYLHATGLLYWTNLWAGYAFTWPVLALIIVAALAMADRRAGWAVPAAMLIGTLLVQTDVSTLIPVGLIGLLAVVVRMVRVGPRRYLGGASAAHRAGGHAAGGTIPTRGWSVSPAALALLALVAAAWVSPVVEQATTNPGNMTLLVRFARQGSGGYPLRTASAAVGAALSVFPLGSRWVLRPGVQAHLGAGPWWAVGVTLATLASAVALAVIGWRRGRTFAGDLAALSALGIVAGVVAMSRVDGPLNFYLLTWISVLPVAVVLAAVLVLAPRTRRRPIDWLTVVALIVGVAVSATVVVEHGTEHDWDRHASADVAAEYALATRALGSGARGLVFVHVVTSDTWQDAAGVALQLERRGARIEVDANWVFLFGDAFAPRPARPTAEVWFARPHEAPSLRGQAGVTLLGAVGGIDVFGRRG